MYAATTFTMALITLIAYINEEMFISAIACILGLWAYTCQMRGHTRRKSGYYCFIISVSLAIIYFGVHLPESSGVEQVTLQRQPFTIESLSRMLFE